MTGLVDVALAATPDAVDLTSSPILQVIGGLAVLAVTLLTWVAGQRAKIEPAAPPPRLGGVEIFLDGPLVQTLEQLKRMATAMETAVAATHATAQMRDEMAERFVTTRHEARNLVAEWVKRFEIELEELEKRVRVVEGTLGVVDDRVKTLMARTSYRPPRG